jgi:hypothetical protein
MMKPAMPVSIRLHDGERSAIVLGSDQRRSSPAKKADHKKADEKQGTLL